MNRILVLVYFFSVFFLVSCSSAKNQEIFESFEGEEGVYMIKLPPGLFLNMIDKGTEVETKELGNIDYVKLLMFDEQNSKSLSSREIVGDIKEKFNKYGYDMAIEFYSSGTGISAYILEKEEYVSDLMLLISQENSLVGLGLSGRLDTKSIVKFASEVDFDDLQELSTGSISF